MNRSERRREERENRKTGGYLDMSDAFRKSLTDAVARHAAEKRIRDRAILAASGPILKAVYAAVILLMTEEYGFTHEACVDLLEKLEDKTLLALGDEDLVEEAFEKTGIRIRFNEGIDRIEEA